jgi:hypothetical protein
MLRVGGAAPVAEKDEFAAGVENLHKPVGKLNDRVNVLTDSVTREAEVRVQGRIDHIATRGWVY